MSERYDPAGNQHEKPADVVLLIHGTGGSPEDEGPRWWQKGSAFSLALASTLSPEIESGPEIDRVFHWTGRNSERDRRDAGKKLLHELIKLQGRNCHLVGHSHGGSAIFHALVEAERCNVTLDCVRSICTVGTPFLTFQPKLSALLAAIPVVAACLALIFGYGMSANLVMTALSLGDAVPSWVLLLYGGSIVLVAALFLYGVWRLASFAWATWRWSMDRARAGAALDRYKDRWRVLSSSEDEAISGLMSSLRLHGEIAPRFGRRDDMSGAAADKVTLGRIFSQALAVPARLLYATYDRVVAGGLIDPFIWTIVRNKAFGSDIPNLTFARVSRFPFVTRFDAPTVEAVLDNKLVQSANASVAAFAPAMRRYFGQAAELGWLPEQLLAKVKSELSMRELVHTGYFDEADFVALLVDHIRDPSRHAIAGLKESKVSRSPRPDNFPWPLHLATQTVPTLMIWSLVLLAASAYTVRVEPLTSQMQVRDALATPLIANAATTEFGTAMNWFRAVVRFGEVNLAASAASTIVDPSQRMQAYIEIASLLPAGDGRKRILDVALDNASSVDDLLEQARLLEAIVDVSLSSLPDNQVAAIWDRVSELVRRSHEPLGNNSQKAEEIVVTRLARAGRYELASAHIRRFYASSGSSDIKSVLKRIQTTDAIDWVLAGAVSDRDPRYNAELYLAAASLALDENENSKGKALALKSLGFAGKMERQDIANMVRWNVAIAIVRHDMPDLADMAVDLTARLTDAWETFAFAQALMKAGYTSLAAAQFIKPDDSTSELVRLYGGGNSPERLQLANAILTSLIDRAHLDEATRFFKSLPTRDTPFEAGYQLAKADLSIGHFNEAVDIVRLNKGLLNLRGLLLADIQKWCAENDPNKLEDVWANISEILGTVPAEPVALDQLWRAWGERNELDSQQRLFKILKDPVATATYRIDYVGEVASQITLQSSELDKGFKDAEASIAGLPPGDNRAWEFGGLAGRLASLAYSTGDVRLAEKLFRQAFALMIGNSGSSDVAEGLAKAANEPWAQELAEKLSPNARKEFARLELLTLVRAGDGAKVLSRLAAFSPGQDRDRAIDTVVVAFAKAGDAKSAKAAADLQQSNYRRSSTLREASVAIVDEKNFGTIIQINEALSDDQAAGGLLDAALKAVVAGDRAFAEKLIDPAMERIDRSLQSSSNSELGAALLIDAACVQGRLGRDDSANKLTERALALLRMSNRARLRLDQDFYIRRLLEAKLYGAAAKVALTTEVAAADAQSDSLIVSLSEALAEAGDIRSLDVALRIGQQDRRHKDWLKAAMVLIERGDADEVSRRISDVLSPALRFEGWLAIATWWSKKLSRPLPMQDFLALLYSRIGGVNDPGARFVEARRRAATELVAIKDDTKRSAASFELAQILADTGEFYRAREICRGCSSVDSVRADTAIAVAATEGKR